MDKSPLAEDEVVVVVVVVVRVGAGAFPAFEVLAVFDGECVRLLEDGVLEECGGCAQLSRVGERVERVALAGERGRVSEVDGGEVGWVEVGVERRDVSWGDVPRGHPVAVARPRVERERRGRAERQCSESPPPPSPAYTPVTRATMAVPAPRPPPATTTTPAAPQSNLTPTLFRRLFPRPYLERFLDQRIRPDGRTLDTSTPTAQCWREPSANTGQPSPSPPLPPPAPPQLTPLPPSTGSVSTAPSSTLVRLGKTSVVCGITLEVAAPDLTRPNEGFIGSLVSSSFRRSLELTASDASST